MTTVHRVGFFVRMPTGSSTAYVRPEENPVTQDQATEWAVQHGSDFIECDSRISAYREAERIGEQFPGIPAQVVCRSVTPWREHTKSAQATAAGELTGDTCPTCGDPYEHGRMSEHLDCSRPAASEQPSLDHPERPPWTPHQADDGDPWAGVSGDTIAQVRRVLIGHKRQGDGRCLCDQDNWTSHAEHVADQLAARGLLAGGTDRDLTVQRLQRRVREEQDKAQRQLAERDAPAEVFADKDRAAALELARQSQTRIEKALALIEAQRPDLWPAGERIALEGIRAALTSEVSQ